MNDLVSYLWSQARRRPLATAQFATGELWRRGRLRWKNSLEKNLPGLSCDRLPLWCAPFLPAGAHNAGEFVRRFPAAAEATVERARQFCRHEFEIFGERVTFGPDINWHADWITGQRWPLERAGQLRFMAAAPGAEIKRPWELARFHHLLQLGKAFRLTREPCFATAFAADVRHWIRQNPYPRGIHWVMPMEVAIRAANWATAAALFADQGEFGEEFWQEFLSSLFLHGRYAFAHREWNPVARGNHYLCCLVGLLHLGVLFHEFPEGKRWLAFARKELAAEIDAQVGEDGAAHEGSSGYHTFVTELMLTAALLLARFDAREGATPEQVRAALARSWGAVFADRLRSMFAFPAALVAGRERPPLWGDADDGRLLPFCSGEHEAAVHLLSVGRALFPCDAWPRSGHDCEEVWWRLGPEQTDAAVPYKSAPGTLAFREAGFFFFAGQRLRGSIRCGPLGVNGWANHAHCDQLSFEFCWMGRPIVVDPGTYAYSGDARGRNLFRSTRSHNTVVVAGAEQNRFWPRLLFRMMDDTRSRVQRWEAGDDRVEFAGEHFGYRRLPQNVTLRRRLLLETRRDLLLVYDTLEGVGSARLDWFFHLAPDLLAVPVPIVRLAGTHEAASEIALKLLPEATALSFEAAWRVGPVSLLVWGSPTAGGLESAGESGWVAPRYGRRSAAPVLRFSGQCRFPVRALFVFGATEDFLGLTAIR